MLANGEERDEIGDLDDDVHNFDDGMSRDSQECCLVMGDGGSQIYNKNEAESDEDYEEQEGENDESEPQEDADKSLKDGSNLDE